MNLRQEITANTQARTETTRAMQDLAARLERARTAPAPAAPVCVACVGDRTNPDGGTCLRCKGSGIDPDPLAPAGIAVAS
jgi:hypothetical protein